MGTEHKGELFTGRGKRKKVTHYLLRKSHATDGASLQPAEDCIFRLKVILSVLRKKISIDVTTPSHQDRGGLDSVYTKKGGRRNCGWEKGFNNYSPCQKMDSLGERSVSGVSTVIDKWLDTLEPNDVRFLGSDTTVSSLYVRI